LAGSEVATMYVGFMLAVAGYQTSSVLPEPESTWIAYWRWRWTVATSYCDTSAAAGWPDRFAMESVKERV